MNATAFGFLSFSLFAGSGFMWYRGIRDVALPENRFFFLVAWFGAATLGLMALTEGVGWIGGISATIGMVGGTMLLVLFAISKQKVADDAITVGAMIPSFHAIDEDGQRFESASLEGRPTLIKFFRGHW